jgi:hypothetical protein
MCGNVIVLFLFLPLLLQVTLLNGVQAIICRNTIGSCFFIMCVFLNFCLSAPRCLAVQEKSSIVTAFVKHEMRQLSE